METFADSTATAPRKWRTLNHHQRRVLGVLIEKAKTTPESYPLTVNALVTGSNQKNNRFPLTELDADQVEAALEVLRSYGAVAEIQGSGRAIKYRHLAYDWFGIDKVELAVMTELLLRGAQTVGELRGRAARMEAIADLSALKPVLDSLAARGLVIELSAAGRGQIVSHGLYEPRELERVRADAGVAASAAATRDPEQESVPMRHAVVSTASSATDSVDLEPLRRELGALRQEVAALRAELDTLSESHRQAQRELAELRTSLGG